MERWDRIVWSACVVVSILLIAERVRASPITIQGVKVHVKYDRDVYFPPHKQQSPFNARCTQATSREIRIATKDVRRFLKKYNRQTIRNNLKHVFVCGMLRFHGVQYAGTYIDNGIYVDNDDPYFHMHHEFSSILMRNRSFGFPWTEWVMLRSGQGNRSQDPFLTKKIPAYKQTRALLQKGFWIAYAATDLENDFNVVATYYMTDRTRLKRKSAKYPKMKAKYDIVDRMYKGLIR